MRWLQRVWSRTNLCPLWIESPFLSLLQPSCLAPGLRPMGAPPLENLLTIKRCEQKASAPVPGWTEQPHPSTHPLNTGTLPKKKELGPPPARTAGSTSQSLRGREVRRKQMEVYGENRRVSPAQGRGRSGVARGPGAGRQQGRSEALGQEGSGAGVRGRGEIWNERLGT